MERDSVFRVAVDEAPTGIVVADEEGTILYANKWIEHIFRSPLPEITGRPIHDLIPTIGRAVRLHGRSSEEAEPALGPSGTPCSLPGRRPDGTDVPLEVSWTIAEQDVRQLLVLAVVAISERQLPAERSSNPPGELAGFERLEAALTMRFLMVASEGIEQAIVASLQEIANFLGLDRSTWWHVTKGDTDPLATYTWTRPEYRLIPFHESAGTQVPWMLAKVRSGEPAFFNDPEDVPSAADREAYRRFGTKSGAALPFVINGELRGLLGFSAIRHRFEWTPELIDRLRLVAAVFGQAVVRKETEDELRHALEEVRRLRDNLAGENVVLRREVRLRNAPQLIVAESAAGKRVLERVESVAATSATVLLLGETGTGKEVYAQAIHRASDRRARAMVTVNCGAIPDSLIESELFGREKGAFTGALARQIGRFEMAHDSTIFLDEIGELPLEAQVKLLRVIQERVVERLGGGQPVKVNVRIIAATNRNLEKAIADRTFREDLFYRLNVFPIVIPPLRERVEDIPALVWTFIEEYSATFRKPIESLSRDSLAALKRYPWPGNVRELRNVIERAIILCQTRQLIVDVPAGTGAATPHKFIRLHDLQVQQIRAVLESVGWRVRGPGGAAELLGLKPTTLDSRMARLNIRRPPRRGSK